MRPTDVTKALAALIPTRRPIYLWGPPGVGKSSLVETGRECAWPRTGRRPGDAARPGRSARHARPSTGDMAVWCPPAFLPMDGQGILFLDELAQAAAFGSKPPACN